eukprot:10423927-Lingulodinium_polyedra.AAC.1
MTNASDRAAPEIAPCWQALARRVSRRHPTRLYMSGPTRSATPSSVFTKVFAPGRRADFPLVRSA